MYVCMYHMAVGGAERPVIPRSHPEHVVVEVDKGRRKDCPRIYCQCHTTSFGHAGPEQPGPVLKYPNPPPRATQGHIGWSKDPIRVLTAAFAPARSRCLKRERKRRRKKKRARVQCVSMSRTQSRAVRGKPAENRDMSRCQCTQPHSPAPMVGLQTTCAKPCVFGVPWKLQRKPAFPEWSRHGNWSVCT
jgi:hypothetical protein